MAKVTIYTRPGCGYCVRAKQLLVSKGSDYNEYNVWAKDEYMQEMLKRSGGSTTVPQIFIGDTHVGGSDDLDAAIRGGYLVEIFASEAVAA